MSEHASSPSEDLLKTPLYALHLEHGARMVPFAGYAMPVQYASGVLKEHLHTRAHAGLFDVSHMGQIIVRAKSGTIADAARALERLLPIDVLGLEPARQRYGFFTNASGGILDDLMVAHRGGHLLLVVNAACKAADEAYLRTQLQGSCEIEPLNRALLAVQGPKAQAALHALAPACAKMRFMDVQDIDILGAPCIVSRSGYTGEDGFEISTPPEHAHAIASALLSDADVKLAGLGARDSLRLEAGLCLYGADLDAATSPVEAGLTWAMQACRLRNGAREGGFPGADLILDQMERGPQRVRAGFLPEGRAPVRAGSAIFASESANDPCGSVTSGGFGPSADRPVAMGYVAAPWAKPGTRVFALVRGKPLPMIVTPLPFIAPKYKRGARPIS